MKFTSFYALALASTPMASAFVAPVASLRAAPAAGLARQSSSSSDVCQMMAGGRVPIIAGNWKMNPLDLATAKDLAKKVGSDFFMLYFPCTCVRQCLTGREQNGMCCGVPREIAYSWCRNEWLYFGVKWKLKKLHGLRGTRVSLEVAVHFSLYLVHCALCCCCCMFPEGRMEILSEAWDAVRRPRFDAATLPGLFRCLNWLDGNDALLLCGRCCC